MIDSSKGICISPLFYEHGLRTHKKPFKVIINNQKLSYLNFILHCPFPAFFLFFFSFFLHFFMSPFSHLFVSKSRKVPFEVSIIIRDLVNIPLVSGYYYVSWKLKHATHTGGSTPRLICAHMF